jgi:hypothetical protein
MAESNETSCLGSCLCGDIRWQVSGALSQMSHCHCSMCRKAHGSAFATYAVARGEDFRWLSGEQKVRHFESSPGFNRPFCGRCGSCVPGVSSAFPDEVGLPVGPLEGDVRERPLCHIFVASAAPWYGLPDDLPHYSAYDPGEDLPEVSPPADPVAVSGKITGSCLCGGVAYAIEGELKGLVNCHCSRCRRARSAAHASNGFTTPSKLEWLRGQELLCDYRVPDAEVFGQTFCNICGSAMPRADREHDRVVVPAGSLDVDPGVREGVHIFFASKASWFEVADELPRFDEAVG